MTTLTNAKAFKGILQYKSTDNFTKEAGYVYFIREFNENGEETGNAEIYFGNRKYGDVNNGVKPYVIDALELANELGNFTSDDDSDGFSANGIISQELYNEIIEAVENKNLIFSIGDIYWNYATLESPYEGKILISTRFEQVIPGSGGAFFDLMMFINEETLETSIIFDDRGDISNLLDGNLKTVNGESLVGSGNIAVGNIISEEDDSLTIDDVNTNTYVKYVAQTLTEEQKAQVRTNISAYSKPSAGIPKTDLASAVQTSLGLADTSIQSKIVTSTVRTGTVNISANTMTNLTSGLTGSTTIKITHQTLTSDAEWGVKFFINGTTVPSITFASSSTSYPIAWINDTTPSFETGYMYEVTFKQFNNKYLAVCGKFKI